MSTTTPFPPASTGLESASVTARSRPDLDIDFLLVQLRGTFQARLDQLLTLPSDDPRCVGHAAALDEINAALARIHDGTYGACAVCGDPISAARLEVVPTTTTCVSCTANRQRT